MANLREVERPRGVVGIPKRHRKGTRRDGQKHRPPTVQAPGCLRVLLSWRTESVMTYGHSSSE